MSIEQKEELLQENLRILSSEMDPFEYSIKMEYAPLSKKEMKKGKNINIYNTKDPMPWDKIFNHIRMGLPYEDLHIQYGKLRKIVLIADMEGVKFDQKHHDLMSDEYEHRKQAKELAVSDPVLALSIHEAVNNYFPDLSRQVAIFANAVVQKSIRMVNEEDTTSNDISNLTSAVQKATDTVELTQRHGAGVNVNGGAMIAVTGFDYVLDPPTDHIDAEISEDA